MEYFAVHMILKRAFCNVIISGKTSWVLFPYVSAQNCMRRRSICSFREKLTPRAFSHVKVEFVSGSGKVRKIRDFLAKVRTKSGKKTLIHM